VGVVVAAMAALAVAGCGSSSDSGSSTSSTGASAAKSSSPVSGALTKYEAATTDYQLPTEALKDVGRLKGKTIAYVPVASVVPEFAITAARLKDATAAVGAKLNVCSDPRGTPSEWNACVGQAIANHVAAIVLDAAPWQVVANQLKSAQKQGIKVVLADQQPSDAFASKGDNAFILGVSGEMQKAVADWVIDDSSGKGEVLLIQNTDGPSPIWYVQNFAMPEFKQHAPDLKIDLQTISTANQSQLASDVSSKLLKNPNTDYVYTEFDQFLPDAQKGVQSANAINKVKGVSTTGTLAGLQLLKEGRYSYADAGQDYPYTAWAIADEAYRLILGQDAVEENIPMRLFTRDNVKDLQLTNAAQSDGSWYGPTTYPTEFKKLWGVG
jgi:ribose transport system substrate-binding protein